MKKIALQSLTYLLFGIVLLASCNSEKSTQTKAAEPIKHERKTTWTDKDMEFQMSYCLKMMATLEKMDKEKYCDCFLNKVKFYYEPIDVLHAYRNEVDISGECMQLHYEGEVEEGREE